MEKHANVEGLLGGDRRPAELQGPRSGDMLVVAEALPKHTKYALITTGA